MDLSPQLNSSAKFNGVSEELLNQYSKAFWTQIPQITQITQICASGMNGLLEPPQRGVPNAATLGDMESLVDKKQARPVEFRPIHSIKFLYF